MFRVVFNQYDDVFRGDLIVDTIEKSKSGKSYNVTIGKCTCNKNTCDCIIDMNIPAALVKKTYEIIIAG